MSKIDEAIELLQLAVQEVRENNKPAYLIIEKYMFDKALRLLKEAKEERQVDR